MDLGIGFWAADFDADFAVDFGVDFDMDFCRIFCRIFFCGGFSDFSGIGGGFLRRIFFVSDFSAPDFVFNNICNLIAKNPTFFGAGFSDSQNPPSRRISDFRIFKIHRCGGFPDFCKKKSTVEIRFFDELCFQQKFS